MKEFSHYTQMSHVNEWYTNYKENALSQSTVLCNVYCVNNPVFFIQNIIQRCLSKDAYLNFSQYTQSIKVEVELVQTPLLKNSSVK